jgi:hypothetical protein
VALALDYAFHIDPATDKCYSPRRILARFLQLAFPLSIAVALRSKLFCMGSLIGATTSTLMAFIVPCACHLRICRPARGGPRWVADVAGMVMGVVFGMIATVAVLAGDCTDGDEQQ